jgi:uncharacterized protein YggE
MNVKRIAIFAGLSAVVMLSLVAATCGTTTTVQNTPGQGEHAISVSGSGKVTGKPDVAKLSLGVSTLAGSVQAARDRAATSLDAMIKSVKANGVADKDVQTQQLSISPEYDYSNNKQVLRGFRVNNTILVTIRDINTTSKTVDDAVSAGGDDTTINSLAFTIDDPKDLEQQARQAAVDDAKAKAQTLAKAAGVQIGDAINISETSYSVPMLYDRSLSGAEKAPATGASTPIEPGELDVTVDVSVTWAIK